MPVPTEAPEGMHKRSKRSSLTVLHNWQQHEKQRTSCFNYWENYTENDLHALLFLLWKKKRICEVNADATNSRVLISRGYERFISGRLMPLFSLHPQSMGTARVTLKWRLRNNPKHIRDKKEPSTFLKTFWEMPAQTDRVYSSGKAHGYKKQLSYSFSLLNFKSWTRYGSIASIKPFSALHFCLAHVGFWGEVKEEKREEKSQESVRPPVRHPWPIPSFGMCQILRGNNNNNMFAAVAIVSEYSSALESVPRQQWKLKTDMRGTTAAPYPSIGVSACFHGHFVLWNSYCCDLSGCFATVASNVSSMHAMK